MPASEARIRANQLNSLKSTGPKTPEGKERSRRNGLKHGLSGSGVVFHEADGDEIERRDDELQSELDQKSSLGMILVRQMATLSVRMERGARQESAALAARVRHAVDDFDEARFDEADRLFDSIADDPRGHLRKLLRSPEGVDRLILAWLELRDDLTLEPRPIWTAWHLERAANLTGSRIDEARGSRLKVLSAATWGDFGGLGEHEGGELDDDDRKGWARARLVERIDAEVADLAADRESLDLEAIELDRLEAGDRALFDPSREASLARRYESEARRGFFKALDQFRRAEAEAAARSSMPAIPEPSTACGPLASSREDMPPSYRSPVDDLISGPRSAVPTGNGAVWTPDGPKMPLGRAALGPG